MLDLLDRGLDINECKNTIGENPVFIATVTGNINLLSVLISRGAKPDIYARCGFTPLHVAIINDNYEIVKMLIENGFDPLLPATAINYKNMSALDIANRLNLHKIISLLNLAQEFDKVEKHEMVM